MDLAEFTRVLRRRWLYVLLPVVLAVGAAAYLSVSATKIYEATASVFFSRPGGETASDLLLGANYTREQIGSYAALATKPIVLDRVIDDLDLMVTPQTLDNSVSARVSADTVIVDVSASSPVPESAAQVANSLAANLGQVVQELSPAAGDDEPAVSAVIVSEAQTPAVPASPNTRLNLVAGMLGGLMIGISAALGRDRLDTRIRDSRDLPEGVPLLATVGVDKTGGLSLVAGAHRSRMRSEAYRRLRTNLRFAGVGDAPMKVICIASPTPGEGKSTTAVNLAVILAEAGHHVVLVDADLRLPTAAAYFGVVPDVGLADVLVSRVPLDSALQSGPSDLAVLASGTIPPNPSELLGSRNMAELVSTLRDSFDYVLIDTPALLPVTDAAIVSALSDGVILVTGYGHTKRGQLDRAMETLSNVGARLLGTVLNRAPASALADAGAYGPYVQSHASKNGREASEGEPEPALRPKPPAPRNARGEGVDGSATDSGKHAR